MQTFVQKQKQNQPQKQVSSSLARANKATSGLNHYSHPILHLQRTIGNQAVLRLLQTNAEEFETGSVAVASPRFAHDFSRIPIHPHATGAIQTQLAINTPGDKYEQEADRAAEQVIRMREPQLQRACACGGECLKCRTNQPGQTQERLQTKHCRASDPGQIATTPIVHEVLATPGQPLDSATRDFMEPRFGHNFGQVRVHADTKAAESARAVDALAYTVGRNVVFGAGQYAPGTTEGRRILAHELTHVIQQNRGPAPHPGMLQRQSLEEVEARAAALESNLSASDRAILRQYIDLLRAGRIHSDDNAEVFATMATLQGAVRRQAETASQGTGAREFGEGALAHSGASFAVAGGLLVDDLSGVGVADDVAIPPAVIYGLGALVLAGGAYLAYAAFSPSEEELEQATEETERLVRDLMDKIAQAARRTKPDTSPELEPEPRPGPSRTTDVFPPIPDERDPRDECLEQNPYALTCEDYRDMETVVIEFLIEQGYSSNALGKCRFVGAFPAGVIDACEGAPGERWHCQVLGPPKPDRRGRPTRKVIGEVSIFGCLCCQEDGTTSFEWRGAHWSINLSNR